jgi:hypothetical protein
VWKGEGVTLCCALCERQLLAGKIMHVVGKYCCCSMHETVLHASANVVRLLLTWPAYVIGEAVDGALACENTMSSSGNAWHERFCACKDNRLRCVFVCV